MSAAGGRPLTGRRVLGIAVGAFAIVVAVNLTMAWFATSGFPGLVVKNSYVASQGWDRARADQAALGWTVAARRDGTSVLVTVTGPDGRPVTGLTIAADIARPTGRRGERVTTLVETPMGYRADIALDPGLWAVDLSTVAPGGVRWTGVARLHLPEG